MDKILGRSFDRVDSNEELSNDIESTRLLLERLSDLDYVLENAALTTILMNYIYQLPSNFNYLIFYYVLCKYETINETNNLIRNYYNIHVEILSVFVHDQSILRVSIDDETLLKELKVEILTKTYTPIFKKVKKYLVDTFIYPVLGKFRNRISLGLENYSFSKKVHLNMDRYQEIKLMESLHEYIRAHLVRTQKVRCLPHKTTESRFNSLHHDFQIKAIFMGLDTQYEHFVQNKKYSYVAKCSKNISRKTFLPIPSQSPSKKWKIKGHTFVESVESTYLQCVVCNIILWGSYPQGLECNNCNKVVHRECKDAAKVCYGKSSKSTASINKAVPNNWDNLNEVNATHDNGTKDSVININNNNNSSTTNQQINPQPVQSNKFGLLVETESNQPSVLNENRLHTPKPTMKPLRRLQEMYSPSIFKDDKLKKANIKSTKSLNNDDYIKSEVQIKRARTPSPDQFNFTSYSPKRIIDKSKTPDSDHEIFNSSMEPFISNEWEFDEEMKVTETFEPEIELKNFPNNSKISFSKHVGAYSRLLVLMEFHHKTRFIHMSLKRFKYLLVDKLKSLEEFHDLFETLSLYCIEELYTLIKSLVETIDKSKLEDTYDNNIGKNVYKWLTDEDDKNLRCWLRLSVDLCCTNVLNSVKANCIEQKRNHYKLNEILSIEFNRMIVIEQLANMRPLLFNLPMIVSKIVKDLERFSEYKEEALIWEEVHAKLQYLPKFIDQRCMHVVDLINNGTINSSSLKYKKSSKESENDIKLEKYFANFPKTVFKDYFINFQFIIISNLRELHLDDSKIMSSVYIKEDIEAAAICYEKKIIILQKENDKYLLKKFKSVYQKTLFPVISFDQVHVTKQTVKEKKHHSFELTILLIEQAILIQILFREERSRDEWYDHIVKTTQKSSRYPTSVTSEDYEKSLTNYSDTSAAHTSILSNLDNISTLLNETLNQMYTDKLKDSIDEKKSKDILECCPNTPLDFLMGYVQILERYMNLGVEMISQSQQMDSTALLQKSIIFLHLNEFKDLNKKMCLLEDYEKQAQVTHASVATPRLRIAGLKEKSIDESENESQETESHHVFNRTREYANEIIAKSIEIILTESRLYHDNSVKLIRQNSESE